MTLCISSLTFLALLFTLPLPTASGLNQAPLGSHERNRGAVASENGVCSQIGIELMKAGGNAADALVGTVFCVGVVDCHHSGPGGGGFALARSSNRSYETIDFRESAPRASHQNMFRDNINASIYGGLARFGRQQMTPHLRDAN